MVETVMRKNLNRLVGMSLLGFWLIGSGVSLGRAETGKTSGAEDSKKPKTAIACTMESSGEKLQRDKAEAQGHLQRLAWQPHDKGNIALLKGDWPGQNPTVIDTLAASLQQAGYQPTLLDTSAFMNPFVVSPERFDLLIITGGLRAAHRNRADSGPLPQEPGKPHRPRYPPVR